MNFKSEARYYIARMNAARESMRGADQALDEIQHRIDELKNQKRTEKNRFQLEEQQRALIRDTQWWMDARTRAKRDYEKAAEEFNCS